MHFSTEIVRDMSEVALLLAVALEKVFVAPVMEQVIMNRSYSTLFKNSYEYYTVDSTGTEYPYNPFEADIDQLGPGELGGIFCRELPRFHIPYNTMVTLIPELDYHQAANPLLYHVIADFLNHRLNEEQQWAKRYKSIPGDIVQNYVCMESLIKHHAPEHVDAVQALKHHIALAKEDFINDQIIAASGEDNPHLTSFHSIDRLYLDQVYEFHREKIEHAIVLDFIKMPFVREALREVEVIISRIVRSFTDIETAVTEKSLVRPYGYDVYQVLAKGNKLVIRNLGDYRILHWELTK